MSNTNTLTRTVREQMNSGAVGEVAAAALKMGLGTAQSKIKVVATALTSAASFDITTAAFLAKCTVTGIKLAANETLPPIGHVVTLRKVTGAQAFPCVVTDADGTATAGSATVPGIATVSDDGKTIGFETSAAVTAFTLEYYPAPKVSLDTAISAGV